MLFSSLLEKIASINEGSSCVANVRLITRLQAGVLRSTRRNWGAINVWFKVGERGAKDVPLSNAGVVATTCSMGVVSTAFLSKVSILSPRYVNLGLSLSIAIINGSVGDALVGRWKLNSKAGSLG